MVFLRVAPSRTNLNGYSQALIYITRILASEQTRMRGAIVIEPKGRERHPIEEDHVICSVIGRTVTRTTWLNY